MIVADTTVLSHFLRRRSSGGVAHPAVAVVRNIVDRREPLAVPGIVFQEILSGVRMESQFALLREKLASFPILLAQTEDHLHAAEIFNACTAKGVSPSSSDCLIAALTIRRDGILLTTDNDFARMAPHCHLKLKTIP